MAAKEIDAPTVISTFAGCGGSSLGYSMSGFRELLAIEQDEYAIKTFKLNFPDIQVYHGDIAELSVENCLEMAGISKRELDVLDGSPPCQGFSLEGKRLYHDSRNLLFAEFVRLLEGLCPKVFVMENVAGLVIGKMKLIFVDILKHLKESGYKVSARILNAKYFSVPQIRNRLIFIGIRDDLDIEPSHPSAETKPLPIKDAWRDVENDLMELEFLRRCGERYVAYEPWDRLLPGESKWSAIRIHPDRPIPTITKINGNISAYGLMHYAEKRRPTLQEFKRAGSFPDGYVFPSSYQEAVGCIGNSVPPLFMRSIARHIRKNILSCRSDVERDCSTPPGDPH